MDLRLAGRVVLVSAASRGLGYAVARAAAAEGARVAIASRDASAVAAAADRIRSVHYLRCIELPAYRRF